MSTTNTPSSAPGVSLSYITIGATMAVLAGTSFFFFDGTGNRVVGYIRLSILVLGIVLMVIGFTVGRIGRAAREVEIPPPQETQAVPRESQAAAARGNPTHSASQAPETSGTQASNTVIQA